MRLKHHTIATGKASARNVAILGLATVEIKMNAYEALYYKLTIRQEPNKREWLDKIALAIQIIIEGKSNYEAKALAIAKSCGEEEWISNLIDHRDELILETFMHLECVGNA